MTKGKLIFGEIEQLVDNWWTSAPPNDPSDVWKTWDRNTYYLWGANSGNYKGIAIGQSLMGGGMAGPHGPTRGRAHPHYVGVITMDVADLPKNDAVFQDLNNLLNNGSNVVVPTFAGKFSLGTGIGIGVSGWDQIQEYLLKNIYNLGQSASSVTIPQGTNWPYPIAEIDDLMAIVTNVLSKETGTGANA